MFGKSKKYSDNHKEEFIQCGIKLRELKRRYEVMLERELRKARLLRAENKRSEANDNRIKVIFYMIKLADNSIERLYEIQNTAELNKSINELSNTLKQLNAMAQPDEESFNVSEDIARMKKHSQREDKHIRYVTDNLEKNSKNKAENISFDLENIINKGVVRAENMSISSKNESSQSEKSNTNNTDVDRDMEEINRYLEGYFDI